MTNEEFAAIRQRLRLTQAQLAKVLDYASAVRVSDFERASNPRDIPSHIARLMRAYDEGYRPSDWPKEEPVNQAILNAFNAAHLAGEFVSGRDKIVVAVDGIEYGQITPAKPGVQDRLETRYGKQVGPAFSAETMRGRIIAVVFDGDAGLMDRAKVEVVQK